MSDDDAFMCGVCEGFYGQPWSKVQRVDLFHKMRCMGMNTYLYAPKDDSKHRMDWRVQYDEEEQQELSSLIESASQQRVTFVYALSPGIDIVYSSKEELKLLKEKLDQVRSFGCKAFALLFDDIENDLCASDRREFRSFADAQSKISNIIFTHLGKPDVFLFCPTEYCSSRASPDVANSEYLCTLGKQLQKDIHILWTGDRVITQNLTIESVRRVTAQIRRQPVIWDNLHANDYDKSRVYLGPYEGRTPKLLNHIRGVLTNPNCEYGANFVALHTLAQWRRNCSSGFDFQRSDEVDENNSTELNSKSEDMSPPFSSPMKRTATSPADSKPCRNMSDDSDDSGSEDELLPDDMVEYESFKGDNNSVPNRKEYHPKLALMHALKDWIPEFYRDDYNSADFNELCDNDNSVSERRVSPRLSKKKCNQQKKPAKRQKCRTSQTRRVSQGSMLTVFDLQFLCDLHYLPFSHGSRATKLLKEAHWLVNNTERAKKGNNKGRRGAGSSDVQEWYDRASQFDNAQRVLSQSFDKLMCMSNRVLLYELYHYISDVRSVMSMVGSYIKWHASGKPGRESFWCTEQEPWVHRGGIHAEFRRLLPHDGANDIFPPQVSSHNQTANMFTIRPYYKEDYSCLQSLSMKTFDDGVDGSDMFPLHPDLVADQSLNALTTQSRSTCLVLEDTQDICGYFMSTLDMKEYLKFYRQDWIPKMQKKYPRPTKSDDKPLTVSEELIEKFYTSVQDIPDDLYADYPSFVLCNVLNPKVRQPSTIRQLITCGLRTLSCARDSADPDMNQEPKTTGVHTLIHVNNINLISWHIKHGFIDVSRQYQVHCNMLVLAKHI